MRHGEAQLMAASDRERALTLDGQQQTSKVGQWLLQQHANFDLILVSPYLRAQQSWQLLAPLFKEDKQVLTCEELTPDADPSRAVDLLLAYGEYYQAKQVLVLAHMPLLGYMVSDLVMGSEPPLFATSGIALIEPNQHLRQLSWLYTPYNLA